MLPWSGDVKRILIGGSPSHTPAESGAAVIESARTNCVGAH